MGREQQTDVGIGHLEGFHPCLEAAAYARSAAEGRRPAARTDRHLRPVCAVELADQPDRAEGRSGAGDGLDLLILKRSSTRGRGRDQRRS